MTDCQLSSVAAVRPVQVIPSGLVITRFPAMEPATATKSPLPYVTEFQPVFAADVRLVQVTPSGLVITRFPSPVPATATKSPLP